jgi:peptidoglycan hydrolase CwlO-like protein
MIKNIIATVIAAFVITVGSLNGWAWQIQAVAEQQSELTHQLKQLRLDKLDEQIYDLESKQDSDDWNERDQRRLEKLERQLEDERTLSD